MKQNKFLIGAGCSYGKVAFALHKWKEYLDIDDDTIIIDLQKDSQSSNYSADSIIYVCNKLIENGVDVENIFVVNEWTTFDRLHYTLPSGDDKNSFYEQNNHSNIIHVHNAKNDEEEQKIKSLFNMTQFFDKNGFQMQIQTIDGLFYVNPGHINVEEYKDTSIYEWLHMFQKHSEGNINESLIINYLNNILKLQYYLKGNNINYNFHFINSQLSGFRKDAFGSIYHHMVNPTYRKGNKVINQRKKHEQDITSLNSKSDINNIFPECKSKFNEIDFSKFWLFEKNNYRYGGIDEWTFCNLPIIGYTNHAMKGDESNLQFFIEQYGNHPNPIAYFLISEEILSECSFINHKPNAISDIKNQIQRELNGNDVSENEIFSNIQYCEEIFRVKLEKYKI